MQIALDEGRQLANTDGDGTLPVAVISKSLARRYFQKKSPWGKGWKVGQAADESPWLTIVGIVDDVHYSWINKDDIQRSIGPIGKRRLCMPRWSCAPPEIRAHSSIMFAAK